MSEPVTQVQETLILKDYIYPIFLASKCLIKNSVAIVPTSPNPGNPSIIVGLLGLDLSLYLI